MCNKVSANPKWLLEIAEAFDEQGIDVYIIFDGAFRHHSKRAKAIIKAIETQAALMQLRDGGIMTEVEEKIEKTLARRLKTKESQSHGGGSNRFHPAFAEAVMDLVETKGSPNILSGIAQTQADTVLAKLVLNNRHTLSHQNSSTYIHAICLFVNFNGRIRRNKLPCEINTWIRVLDIVLARET